MNRWRWWLVLGLALRLSAWAQEDEGQTVSGFRVPDYDEQNRLKSELFGDVAKILPDGIIEITRLKIDFYSGDKVSMTVTAPYCKYDQRNGKAESDSEVRIVREKMVVTGVGFTWNAVDQRFKLLKQAKVVLIGAKQEIEGEEPGAEE
jgi:hypothetical protein